MDIVAESPRRIQNGPRRFDMAKQTRRTGRPPSTPGQPKRSAFNTRLRAETKQRLEDEARIAGRSLSEEIEFRLEQSFRDEAAYGGRNTNDVLKVMGAVAAQIQTRTGKTAADWKTGLAIGRAWKRLITDWVPRPPAEWIAEMERLSDDLPDMPVPPKLPKEPIRGGLLVPRAPEEEWEAYEASLPDFIKKAEKHFVKSAEYKRVYDQNKAALRRKLDEVKKAAEIGEEVLGLLSDQEK